MLLLSMQLNKYGDFLNSVLYVFADIQYSVTYQTFIKIVYVKTVRIRGI